MKINTSQIKQKNLRCFSAVLFHIRALAIARDSVSPSNLASVVHLVKGHLRKRAAVVALQGFAKLGWQTNTR